MSPRKFDRFMLDVNIGTNRKIRRLTPPERWCHVAGVLSVAAQAPIRGRLLIGQQEPELRDYAEQAGVSLAVAKSTMAKLRDLAVVVRDEEHGCEMVHDWGDFNPEPTADPTNADRQTRYRDRRRLPILDRDGHACVVCGSDDGLVVDHVVAVSEGGSNDSGNLQTLCKACSASKQGRDDASWKAARYEALGNTHNAGTTARVTGDVTLAEVTPPTPGREEKRREEKKSPPKSPQGETAGEETEKAEATRAFDEWLLNHSSVTGMTPPRAGTKARAAVREAFFARLAEGYSIAELKSATRGAQADEHRRTNGYVGPDSVLRPTKIHGLIENGRRLKPAGRASDLVDLLPGNREDAAA